MTDNRVVYLDTSVLAKWYLAESNSEQVSDYIIGLDSAVGQNKLVRAKEITGVSGKHHANSITFYTH